MGLNIGRFKGTHFEVGKLIGQSLRGQLLNNIKEYIDVVNQTQGVNYEQLEQEAYNWFKLLPTYYQEEIEGISEGSNVSLVEIAKWYYSDYCSVGGCTSFITSFDSNLWVGRNNDYIKTNFWNYVSIIEVEGKIPVMLFGLPGSSFSGTGYNKDKLWIHYNYLPVYESPQMDENIIPSFVWVRLALESCHTIHDVLELLSKTIRDSGMNLFVVDGKTNEYAVFECTCQSYVQRTTNVPYIVGANHYNVTLGFDSLNSEKSTLRQSYVEKQLINLNIKSKEEMMKLLGDEHVEVRGEHYGTVYSNLCCPANDIVFFAADCYPAASQSNWKLISWEK